MIETDNKLKGKIKSNSSIKGSGIFVKGETGNGIEKIEKTNTEGLIDTYTIYYTDGTTSTFQVSNGGKGDKGDKPIKGVDYFTPAEVQDIQNNILDNVNQFSVEVVETLPIQNIKDHTIYFVPKTIAEQNDIYDEYIYINNSWEHIGNAIKNNRLKIEGKSEQTGEPTVANPVKIRNLGDNINLFDKSLIGTNYKYNNGLKLDRDNLRTTTIILTKKIKPGKYTVSFKYGSKSTSNNFGIQFLNGSETIINVTFTTEKTKTFTINGEVDRLYFYINTAQASGIVLYLDEIKLEEGLTATTYTEYGCGSIDYKATNDSDGNLKNNRFENSNIEQGAIGAVKDSLYANCKQESSTRIRTKELIAIEKDKTCIVRFNKQKYEVVAQWFNDDKKLYGEGSGISNTWQTDYFSFSDVPYVAIAVRKKDKTNITPSEIEEVELKVVSQKQNISFYLSSGQQLHNGDYIDNNGIHQRRKTYTIGGSETITRRGYVDSTNKTYRYSIELKGRDINSRTNLICSHLPTDDQYIQNKSLIFGGGSKEGNIVYFQFVLDEIGVTDVTKISDYLKSQYENGTPVIVEYQLAKEIVTPLTKEQIEAFYELQKAKYVNKMELTCLNEIEPTLVDIEKSLEESLLDNEEAITNIKEQHEYSTEEQIVGTFLGKPLYRKVINCGSLPNNTQKIIQHNIENIDFIISCSGYAMTSTGSGLALPSYNGIINTNLYATTQQIGIVTTGDRSSFVKSYVVLEYTKTTD